MGSQLKTRSCEQWAWGHFAFSRTQKFLGLVLQIAICRSQCFQFLDSVRKVFLFPTIPLSLNVKFESNEWSSKIPFIFRVPNSFIFLCFDKVCQQRSPFAMSFAASFIAKKFIQIAPIQDRTDGNYQKSSTQQRTENYLATAQRGKKKIFTWKVEPLP